MTRNQPTILQILPELRSGGVERGTIEIAEALAVAGWRSLVVSAGGPMTEQLKRVNASHIELPVQSKNPFTILRNARRLEEIIKTHEVDIVHARSRAPAWSAWMATRNTQTAFITTFHGVYGLENNWKKKYNEVMVRGERVIAVSNFVAEHILSNYPCDPEKIRVIHRGADVERFRPELASGPRIMQLAQSWHLPEDKPVILMPGRITRWKGQHVLLEALHKLPHRNFVCILLGESGHHTGYKQELEAMIEQLDLVGHARIIPPTTHMVDAYALAHMVVVPSIEPEAFGRVPVEAQAMGKPVITTDHGGACETVEHGITGWRIKPNDADALADAIQQVLNLPAETLQQMGETSRQRVCEHFSTAAMCNKTLDLYEELLNLPKHHAAAA